MRSENGIPRPFQPNNLAQKVADLERELAALKARRNFVSVERIVEGGTINENVGKQITDTVQKDIVIDGGNLGEGALDGQRMVGAIIETNATANRGVKIDDNGLRGYDADGNQYIKADETGLSLSGELEVQGQTLEATPRPLWTRLTNVQRSRDGNTAAATPGLVFSTDAGYSGQSAPGVYSPNGNTLRLQGANYSGMYQMEMATSGVTLTHPYITLGRFDVTSQLTQTFDVKAANINIGHKADGSWGDVDSNVNLLGNVKVNGAPVALSDSGWKNATYLNSWMDYGNGFGGLQYRLLNSVLYLRGTIKGGARNSIVTTLPAGYRPSLPSGAEAMELPITVTQSGTLYAGTMYAYGDGRLLYNAVPSTWSGFDRAVINAAFPL